MQFGMFCFTSLLIRIKVKIEVKYAKPYLLLSVAVKLWKDMH
jgi:hypothetical protein